MDQLRAALFRIHQLTGEEWDVFAASLQPRSYNKGEDLTRAGQTEQYIYFIREGATRNYFIRDGKEFTVDFHFAGDFVTAYYSLITREPSAITITAIADTMTWAVPYSRMQQFYDQFKNGERIGRLIAESAYVKRLRREMELMSLTAEERYGLLMARHPELVQELSVKHLSSYLGIQPQSLSRIRKAYSRN